MYSEESRRYTEFGLNGPKSDNDTSLEKRINAIPISRYRNFCIVAHIDHGKSTLCDRLLELTHTVKRGAEREQYLDKLDVERQRGITVKAQTCSMIYRHTNGLDYLFHLVDTPGHVDFRAEVSRSYASCNGAILLIDASQGVQAQTVANFYLAFAQGLTMIPVINKIDLATANVKLTLEQLQQNFEIEGSQALLCSAKTGQGVNQLLPTIVEQIPAPLGDSAHTLRFLLVDSWYDVYRGVIILVRVFDGIVKAGVCVRSFATGRTYTVGEIGIMNPEATRLRELRAGQVGYVYFNPGMKNMHEAKIGDTFTVDGLENSVEPLPGFEEPQSMVYVSAFPVNQNDYHRVYESINRLCLNDRSVHCEKDASAALGAGWRLGFLGSLHCSVFRDRLQNEHGANLIITPPSVPFKLVDGNGVETIHSCARDFPDNGTGHGSKGGREAYEAIVNVSLTMPISYLGKMIELCESQRGRQQSVEFATLLERVKITYELPLSQLVDDFFGKVKSLSEGYATMDYEDAGWRKAKLCKLRLLVNKIPIDALSMVVHQSIAQRLGRQWVQKFKEHVPRQMFEVVIQAAQDNRIIARESIKAFRKDVLAKLHASDISRRRKLLAKQTAGKKRLKSHGTVTLDNSVYVKFLATS